MIIAFDLDGTLADGIWYGEGKEPGPIADRIAVVNRYFSMPGYTVLIHTARREYLRHATEAWLKKHGVHHHALVMEKLAADIYVDDKAVNDRHFFPHHSLFTSPVAHRMGEDPYETIEIAEKNAVRTPPQVSEAPGRRKMPTMPKNGQAATVAHLPKGAVSPNGIRTGERKVTLRRVPSVLVASQPNRSSRMVKNKIRPRKAGKA